MLNLDTLTEADIGRVVGYSAIKKSYGLRNRVTRMERIGNNRLTAEVIGSQTYQVEIEISDNNLNATCTCPYAYSDFCKHIGAVLLKWLSSPQSFTAKATPQKTAEEQRYGIRVFSIEPPSTTPPKEKPAWLQKPYATRIAADHQEAVNTLNHLKLEELRQLAKARGWTVKGTRKDDVINQVLTQMAEPGQNLRALAQLDTEHRQALWSVALLGDFSSIQMHDLERGAAHWGALKQHSKFVTYLRHLAAAGLITLFEQRYYGTKLASIPRPAIRHFPPLLADVVTHSDGVESSGSVAELQLANAEDLPQAAIQIMLLLEQMSPPLRTPMPRPQLEKSYRNLEGWDYVPAELQPLEKLVKNRTYQENWLSVPPPLPALPDEVTGRLLPLAGDAARLEFILALLWEAALLQPGSPVTVWAPGKEAFLRQSGDAQRATLIHTYFRMQGWTELWEVLRSQPTLRLTRQWTTYGYGITPQALQTDLAGFRRLVLQTLAWLPDNRWVKVDDLFKLLRSLWPQFDQGFWSPYGQQQQVTWRLSKSGQPLDKNNMQSWLLAQGNFILTMLRGPLAWLGLVDLALHNGIVTHLRLHGLADLYWDRRETIEAPAYTATHGATPHAISAPPPTEALTLEGDLVHVQPSAIRAQAHTLLDRIARLEVAQPQHFVYRLDASATHQTFERGGALGDLISEWQQHLGVPMPASVRSRLQGWWDAYGQVRLYKDVTVIEFGDDYASTEMKAVTSLNDVLIAEISPRLVLIPKDAVKTLAAELEKAGYTPQQTDKTE